VPVVHDDLEAANCGRCPGHISRIIRQVTDLFIVLAGEALDRFPIGENLDPRNRAHVLLKVL
jgi:hypothetical protein